MLSELLEKSNTTEPCKGKIYRFRKNMYQQDGKIEYKETFTLLKRKSCPGCEQCDWMLDDLTEYLGEDTFPDTATGLKDGDICELVYAGDEYYFRKLKDIGKPALDGNGNQCVGRNYLREINIGE